ncbi:PGL/p-HBAD biosynthesis glycosyltransferase [Shimia sp. SK013]|uniref:TIGR04283 family arsenosugar biosynthesis glycosyltransferase n=1 Tax=Shimia sp. SK013 TaxID=1389006 RepID=UPI0006B50C27|nr:TIGR04283 family arsenosugar biosynthesis glycosyltransferase [Shimia sp. SK013]KPA21313.1 PGL/p-HBAD biosynthesis glycosyltransferase [Shimia sp. SK013]
MRAPLSVVIPTLNAEVPLPSCLAALYEGVEVGVIRELIVVDGGSNDATRAIADEAGAMILTALPSRGGQLGAGVEAARGDWVLCLHADTELAPGWTDAVGAHMARGPDVAGYFRLGFDSGGASARAVARWANVRSQVLGLPYGDQGLLMSRKLYREVGGYSEIPLMEDVAMARALKRRLRSLEHLAVTSAAKYQAQGWARRGARNLWTLIRYFAGVSPERLAQSYRK